MRRRSFLLGTVAGATALAGCYALAESGLVDIDDLTGDDPTTTPSEEPGDSDIAIRDTEFRPGSGAPGARGCLRMTVENVGEQRLSSIDLRPQFFDDSGHRIRGSARSLHNLDPGERWQICDRYPGSGTDVSGNVVTGSFQPGTTVTDPGDVELLDDRLLADQCRTAVSGAIRNTGNDAVPYVQVLAKFYTDDGSVVASGHDHTLDLEPGGLWDYAVDVETSLLERPATHHSLELSGPWW